MKKLAAANAKTTIHTNTMKNMTITALMAAMITILTAYMFHIPVGINGGYIHLGDTLIYLAASILPLPYACAAGMIGGGLADLLTAPVWAPATIIIKGLVCIPFTSKGTKIITKRNVLALVAAAGITILGYYIAEGIIYGFTMALFISMVGNVVQTGGSAVIYFVLASALDRVGFKSKVV